MTKNYDLSTAILDIDEFNPLKELEYDIDFENEYVKWSELHERWSFEDLENFAQDYYRKNRMN